MMMKALVSLSLLAACAADMPSRRMQAATTTPPPTTTPGTTVTTTPGASFQSTGTVGSSSRRLSSSGGRRLTNLPAVTPSSMGKAYCSALRSAGGYCTSTATLSNNVWTIIATITTTAGGSAATQAAITALTTQLDAVGTAITTFLVSEGLDPTDVSKFKCTGVGAPQKVPPQPYVPPPAPVSLGLPPFKFSFTVGAYGVTLPSLTEQEVTAIENGLNAHNPMKDYMGYEVDLVPNAMNIKGSLVVPTTMVNTVAATINDIVAHIDWIQQTLTHEFAKDIPNFNGSIVFSNWYLYSVPNGTDATKGTSLVSSLLNSSVRLYQKEQQEGNFFDIDDDAEDDAEDEKTVGSIASWTMPTLGVVALVTAVALIGFSMRRRTQSLSAYNSVSSSVMETETPIQNELESPLE